MGKKITAKKAGELFPVVIILALGIFARVWLFGSVPGEINQDEAFAGYEAWCILNYGTDTAGYSYPVYLTAWGSGMNALESYLMLPLIALFGLEIWVIRLPQLLLGILSLWVCYLTVNRMSDRKTALWALMLLAICPWHIMLCRWGLESNLAPAFLLFGLYFLLRGLDDSRFMMLSALMYGLSLYTYATIWPVVPFMLLAQLIYSRRKLHFDRYIVLSVLILGLLALPLLLFMAVNYGFMEEIRTPFMSVPELLYVRSGEISFKNIPENLERLFGMLWTQSDKNPWNYGGQFGLLYKLSTPFAVLGIGCCTGKVIQGIKAKRFCPEGLLIIQLLAALVLGALISVNVNRINIVFMPLVIFTAYGIIFFCSLLGNKSLWIMAALYAVLFAGFEAYYFGSYARTIPYYFSGGLESALETTADREGTVYLDSDIHYPKILFYTQMPVDRFTETVNYEMYPAAFLKPVSFDRFSYVYDVDNPDSRGCYILTGDTDMSTFEKAGFSIEQHGIYVLAYKN